MTKEEEQFSVITPVGLQNASTDNLIVSSAVEGDITFPEDANSSFHFALGDVSVNGTPVSFVPAEFPVTFSTVTEMNQYLVTNPFTLDDLSEFYYSVRYKCNEGKATGPLFGNGGWLNFTVELADNTTGEVLGTFDNITYDANNVDEYNNIMYSVNCAGIGEKTVILRLVISASSSAGLPSYGQSYAANQGENGLNKTKLLTATERLNFAKEQGVLSCSAKQIKHITFRGDGMGTNNTVIKEYALSNNYPNPFNPTTTIRYQIPQAGMVNLTLYDILGKEVGVLVNQEQNTGSYTVTFDGSKLASGVYIYKLTAGTYTATKKLNLLK